MTAVLLAVDKTDTTAFRLTPCHENIGLLSYTESKAAMVPTKAVEATSPKMAKPHDAANGMMMRSGVKKENVWSYGVPRRICQTEGEAT